MKKFFLFALSLGSLTASAQVFTALGSGNNIYVGADPTNPTPVTAPLPVQGIASGYTLVAIDYQPGTGNLYGIAQNRVDATAQLYLIAPDAATAVPVGTNLRGARWSEGAGPGLDFGPDGRLYLTNADGSHYELSLDGTTTANLSPLRRTPRRVLSASYSTSSTPGTSGTAQYGYDPAHHALTSYTPNRNTTQTVALPGTPFTANGSVAMDMDFSDNSATAYVAGPAATGTAIYSVDLTTGEAIMLGNIGGRQLRIRDISVSHDARQRVTAQGNTPAGGNQVTEVFSMYPNPARGFTNVLLSEIPQEKVYVYVVNLNGQIMQSQVFDPGANNLYLDVSALQTGLYSIQVQEKGKAIQALKVQVENR